MLEGLRARLQKDKRVRRAACCGGAVAGGRGSFAAAAAAWDGTLRPIGLPGDAQLEVGGLASGAVFGASGHGGQDASGVVKMMPRLERNYDSGLVLGLNATITASDILSRGRYGGDVFEKAYGDVRTGLGRLEIGQTDGAAYDLSVNGPKVDAQVSLDNPQTTFFRDPSTGHAFTDIFTLRTQIGASSNYAKVTYVSPNLFGAQLALSFTPSEGKDVLPFLHEGPHLAGRQADIWEGALKYSGDVGPVTLSAYGGAAVGRAEHKPAGQEGVSDLGTGVRADYSINDDLSVSLGGAWRQSNAYAFQIARSYQGPTTRARQASASVSYDDWTLGVEYGDGHADAVRRRAAAGHDRLSGLAGLSRQQQHPDHHRLAAAELWPQQRRFLQWRAAHRAGCGVPAPQSQNFRLSAPMAAMPAKPGSSAAFCAVTPPSAKTGTGTLRAISRARAADKTRACLWLAVGKTGDSSTASACAARSTAPSEWAEAVISQPGFCARQCAA